MTGEISLRGRILRVGGIKEKVMAAARSGLKQVILPDQNRNDWEEVPNEVREKMEAHFVKSISDLVGIALRNNATGKQENKAPVAGKQESRSRAVTPRQQVSA
jgi:ATP-dependent Lon protease